MRTRSHWLAGGVMAALLVGALIGSATASQFFLGLDTEDTQWPIGTNANLDVTVDPVLLGGYGKLYRKIGDGDVEFVKLFGFDSTSFTTNAPIPNNPELAGNECEFFYRAFTADGALGGRSPMVRKPIPPLEIE